MRIGIDIRCLAEQERTGIGEYTVELLQALWQLPTNHTYHLFSNGATAQPPKLITNGVTVEYSTTRFPNKLLNASTLLFHRPWLDHLISRRIAGQPALDVFFSPTLNFTALSPNVKRVLTIHDLSFIFFPEYFSARQRLWHRLLRIREQCQSADLILAPSHNTKRDVVEHLGIPANKVAILPSGIATTMRPGDEQNVADCRKKYSLPNDYILFLGTLEPRKNILALIKAFEQSFSSLPKQYTLVIAGAAGWNNSLLHKTIAYSPHRDHIKLIGYVAAEDKPALYQGASVFVYPSFYEGFGFPVLETMRCGTPVITSNRSSLPEVAGDAAYYINPHRPEEIAQGLIQILNTPTYKKTLVEKGLQQAQQFSWEKAATEWLQLIERL